MTAEQKSLFKRYIVYKFMTSLWFVATIWLYFYRIFITDQQVGFLDGVAFTIGLLAEVPSGALADKFGRDRIVKLGLIAVGFGLIVQAAGSSFAPFVVGQTILMIGLALISGADEALFFERLKFDRKSKDWIKLVTRSSQASLAASLIATAIGGALYTINPRLPWYVNGLVFAGSVATIWPIKDLRPRSKREKLVPELKSYLADIKMGFAEFAKPKLRLYVPYIVAVQGLFYATDSGLLRLVLLDRFNFSPLWGSVAVASIGLITVGLLSYIHKNAEGLGERKVLITIGLVSAASLLVSVADIGLFGYAVILALYAGDRILKPFLSEALNHKTTDSKRATVLSVASFLKALPYAVLAPVIGYLSSNDKIEYFLVIWAVVIIIALSLYASHKKRRSA